MKISDIHTAKGLKFKLNVIDSEELFTVGDLINIKSAVRENEFLVESYGNNSAKFSAPVRAVSDRDNGIYILELLDLEKTNDNRCMFSV